MNSKKLISLFSTLVLGTSIFPVQLVNADELNHDVQIDNDFKELSNVNDSVIDRFNKFSVFEESLNTKKDVDSNTNVMKKENISSDEEATSSPEKSEESNKQIASSPEKSEESNEQITSSPIKTEESNEQITSSPEKSEESNEQITSSPIKTEESNEQITSSPIKTEESNEQITSSPEKSEESNEQIASSPVNTEESNEQIASSPAKTEESNEQMPILPENTEKSNSDQSINREFRKTGGSVNGVNFNVQNDTMYISGWTNSSKSTLIIDQDFINQVRNQGFRVNNILLATTFFRMAEDVQILRIDSNIDVPVAAINSDSWKRLYENNTNLREFNLGNTKLSDLGSEVTNASYMFKGCTNLEKVVIKDMPSKYFESMFFDCSSLKEVDLGVLTKGIEMGNMFNGCRSLKTVHSIDAWWDNGITELQGMFNNCTSLTEIDLRSWDLPKLKNINRMFNGTTNLKLVRLDTFSPDNRYNYEAMFYGARRNMLIISDSYFLKNYNFSGDYVFPINIKINPNGGTINGSNSTINYFNSVVLPTSEVQKIDMSYFNNYLKSLVPIKDNGIFTKWTPSKNINGISSVVYLDGLVFTANYENYDWTFKENDKDVLLTSYIGTNTNIVVPNEVNGKPTKIDLTQAFPVNRLGGDKPWTKVTSVRFESKNNKKVKAIGNGLWFKEWSKMKSFDGSGLDVSSVRDMNQAFSGCQSLNDINLSGWNTSNVENMSYMFFGCSSLSSIDVSHFSTNNVTTMNRMFNGCTNLTSIDVSHFNTQNVTDFWAMFYECSSLVSLDVSNFDTSKATRIRSMFYGANKLKNIDVSNFNTKNVTDMSYMFEGCTSLSELNLSTWTLKSDAKSVNMTLMFDNTPALRKIDLRNIPLDYQNTTQILGTRTTNGTAVNQPLTVIVNSDTSSKFLNFDFVSESGRVPASFPVLDANGGSFSSGNSTIKYINKICVTPEQLQLSTFNKWKEDNIPNKDGFTFKQWVPSREVDSPQSVFDLLDVTYVAEWKIIENNIPSPDDNVKPDVMSEFGIAYYPKEFSIKNTPLDDSGSQTIPFEKKGTFNMGIRDVSNLKDKWTLDAQLVWTSNKKIEGGEILTTNSEGLVNKNINNGEDPFDPIKDLIPCDSAEIGAKANVVINSNAPTRLMTAKAVTHNGVYDYNLGDKVSLRIPETKNIEAGSYSGYVQWTLSNAIS